MDNFANSFLDVSKWQEILSVRASKIFLNFLAELNKIRQHLIIRKHKSDRAKLLFSFKEQKFNFRTSPFRFTNANTRG